MTDNRADSTRTLVRGLLLSAIAIGVALGSVSLSVTSAGHVVPDQSTAPQGVPSHTPLPTSAAAPRPPSVTPSIAAAQWINLTASPTGPLGPAVYGESVVYDPANATTVLFGGCMLTECPSNQTWIFTSGVWTNVTVAADAPPAREYASADYDANMGGILLFGGEGTSGLLNDTWLYANGHWTDLSYVGPAPSSREAAAMAFDPSPDVNASILYGGCVPEFVVADCTNDTWAWEGWSGWVPLSPSSPPPAVGFSSITYDAAIGDLVLFGGCAGGFCADAINSTWEFYAGQWWPTSASGAPTPRADAAMVYDPGTASVLLFGGANITAGLLGDTWSFSGELWSLLSVSGPLPSAREASVLALDATGTTPLLIGGLSNVTTEDDTWAFEAAPSGGQTEATSVTEVGAPVNFTAQIEGGTSPYSVHWTFGDGTQEFLTGAGSLVVAHVFSLPGNYAVNASFVDAVGAAATLNTVDISVLAEFTLSASASPSSTDVGASVALGASITSGGVPPFTYAWSFGDGAGGAGVNVSHAYSAAGTYLAVVNVTDSVLATRSASTVVQVAPDPTVDPTDTPGTGNSSGVVSFSAGLVGGTPPYSYAWLFGDGTRSASPAPDHQYVATGSYSAQLWVNDSVGESAHSALVVSVSAPSTSVGSSGTSGIPTWFWIGIGVVAAAAVVGSVLILRRAKPGA